MSNDPGIWLHLSRWGELAIYLCYDYFFIMCVLFYILQLQHIKPSIAYALSESPIVGQQIRFTYHLTIGVNNLIYSMCYCFRKFRF